jgi:hypothetical protein
VQPSPLINWVLGLRGVRIRGEKSAPKFIPSSNYHKEEEIIKSTKSHYPSNPKSYFNPKREVSKETLKMREKAFVCMFCGRASHLDEFCLRCKRIEKRRIDYARNSYRDEFIDFPPRSYSHIPPHSYSRASPRASSCALSRFSRGPNHRSYSFGSRENSFVPRRFGTAHVLIAVIISRIGLVFLPEVLTLTLSQDI